MLHNIDALITDLIKKQVANDRRTGAVDLDEACCGGWDGNALQGYEVSDEHRDELVAICGIINDLLSRIDSIETDYKRQAK